MDITYSTPYTVFFALTVAPHQKLRILLLSFRGECPIDVDFGHGQGFRKISLRYSHPAGGRLNLQEGENKSSSSGIALNVGAVGRCQHEAVLELDKLLVICRATFLPGGKAAGLQLTIFFAIIVVFIGPPHGTFFTGLLLSTRK